jgi:hypothetical protein
VPRASLLGVPPRIIIYRGVIAGAVLVTGMLTGLSVVDTPWIAWALAAVMAAAVLFIAPAHIRIGAVVLAAACSRLLVATGVVSNFANFFHFPLALGVALISAIESTTKSRLKRPLEVASISLLGVSLVSWLINRGELIRPFLDWLVFVEPLLIVYAIVNMPPDHSKVKALWMLVLLIPFAQLILAAYQALTLGLGDPVQGFFVDMGAGAHVAGAVSLMGTLTCVSRALSVEKATSRLSWLLGASALFLVAVGADAKQVIIAFLPALVMLLLISTRIRLSRAIFALPLLAVLVLGAFSYYRPLQMVLDWALISRGALGKAQAFSMIAGKLSESGVRWLLGLGPGNSVSRVALMGLETMVKLDSPVRLLGLGPAAVTRELMTQTAANWLYSSSSVWSFVSSWLALLGDLGLAGIGIFLWTFWKLWVSLRARRGWKAATARAVLLMMIILACLYSWLEEPGFTLIAALIVGLGSIDTASQEILPEKQPEKSPAH